jgi:MFS family permease
MPTDGTLFLENLPYSKQYLLTLLSVFFSLGAVLSSTVSYIFLPGSSCAEFEGCDIAGKANDGWRSVLFVLGLFVGICLNHQPLSVGFTAVSRTSKLNDRTWHARSCAGFFSAYKNRPDISFLVVVNKTL